MLIKRPDKDFEPLLVTISEARRLLGGCARRTIYNMVEAGDLEFVRVMSRPMLRLSQIRELAGEPPQAAA